MGVQGGQGRTEREVAWSAWIACGCFVGIGLALLAAEVVKWARP